MRKKYKNLIKLYAIIFIIGFLFSFNINKADAAVRTWTGTTSTSWSVGSNWSGGVAPVTGDDLVFPDGASNLSNTNDLTENTIINSITFSGSGYTLSGNRIILGPGLAGITDSVASGGNTIALDIRLDVTRDIFVTNTAESLTISGRISGVGGINKEGTGTLILSGANTFGGILKINVGVVNARHNTALGTILAGTEVVGGAALELQGNINISYEALALRGWGVSGTGGALRNISGTNTYGGLITLSSAGGTIIKSDSGTLTITGGTTGSFPLIFDGAGNITFSTAPIAGSGTITKNGAGTVTLNFPNTNTGAWTINTGTVLYGTDNALLSSAITVTGGTLDIATYSDIVGAVTLGTLDLASGTITGSTGMLSGTSYTVYQGTISAVIAGNAATLTKSTTGTVVLTRANEYTGATTISAGILEIQDSMSLGLIDGITTVSAGATLQINGSGLSIPEYITFAGTGHLYSGAIRNVGGNNTITGLLTMSAAGMLASDSSTTLTIDSKGISAVTYGLTFTADGDISFTSSAPIYGTSASIVKNGSGTLTLRAYNNFTGATNINSGSVVLSDSGAIPLSTTMNINTGGGLVVDNTNGSTIRLADTLTLNMNGGDFDLYGSSVGDVFETAGTLNISTGQNRIDVHPGSGGSTIMRFVSFARTTSSSVLFRGVNFGNTPGVGVSTLLFTTAPALVGDDGAPGTPTLSILQGAFGDNSLLGNGTDMVTYGRGGIGLRLLNGAGFSNEYTSNINITNGNIKLTTSIVANTSLINSLILDSTASITNPDTPQVITFTSGNILNLVANNNIDGLNTTLAAGTLDFSLRTVENLTISADLTTSGGITKSGTNTLTFSTPKSYTGTTDINRGTLKYGVNDAIATGAININSGTLDIDQYSDTVGVVTLNDGTVTGTTGVLTASSYSVRDGTISAIIGGSGSLTKVTTNTSVRSSVLLTRNNTYTGVTTISGGILKIGASGDGVNSPLGTIDGGTTIANVGSLDLNGFSLSTSEPITSMAGLGFGAGSSVANGNSNMGALMNSSSTSVSYSGAITLTAASRINADAGAMIISSNISGNFALTFGGFSDIVYSGVRSGTSTIVKDGIGNLTLSNGNSSYSGATTISAGTVKLGGVSVGGTNSPLGTTAGATTVVLGSRLDLNGFDLGIAEPLTLNGVGYGLGDFASGALMNNSASAVTFTGLITLGSASTIKADSGDINLTNAGTITGTFGLTLGGTGNGTLASIIGTTTGTVTKINTGTWTLSGQSTYTGATSVNLGTLKLGASGGATNTPLGTNGAGTSVLSGAVFDFNGYTIPTTEALTINGFGINDSGAIIGSNGTFGGTIVLASESNITNPSGTMTITGAVSGAFLLHIEGAGNITTSTAFPTAGTSITKHGSGTFTITGTNVYTGATRVEAGTFAYAGSTTLAGTALTVLGGTFDNGANADTIGTVTLIGGTITNSAALTATTSYTLESGTISGIIAGAIPVTKNTNNTVTLTGVNTISSTTTINAGTLTISGSGSAVSTTITVNLGGTLTLDNSTTAVASRLGDALALTMNGGNFNFIGNTAGASSETTGALTLPTGHNTITVTPGAGGSTTMTFASFSRTAGATVLFGGSSFGSTPGAGVSNLMFTTPPTLTGASGSANSTTISIIKGAFGSATGHASDMVTYNVGNSNGLRLLNGAGFTGEYAGDLQTANANVKLTASTDATTTNTNSLILNGYSVTNPVGATTLPISSASLAGNILMNNGSGFGIAGSNTTLGITSFELNVLATSDSTISATIGTANSGSLTLSGSANVTLSAANPYTGYTYLNGATFTYGASNIISSGNLAIVGGTLNLSGNNDTVGLVFLTAGVINTGSGTFTLGGQLTTYANANFSSFITGNLGLGANRDINISDGLVDNDAVISAVISGAFTLSKILNSGVLILSGNNTYSGVTTVSGGTIRLGATGDGTNTPLGTIAGGTTVSGASSALDLNGYTLSTEEPLTLSGALATGSLQNNSSTSVNYSGLVTLGAASTIISNYGDINITNTGNITGNTFALTIGGAGNGTLASNLNTSTGTLTKNGVGVWTISGGASTYTGLTTISAGTLKLGSAGSGSNTPLGTSAGGVTVTSGAVFDLNGFTLATAEPIGSLSGTGLASIGAFINSSNNSVSYSGNITLAAASRVANYGSGLMTLSGNISGNFALTIVAVGNFTQATNSIRSGNGSATIVKEGSGTLILSGQNTFTGAVTVSTGVLQLGASGGATNTPLGTNAGGVTVSSGAVLDFSTYSLGGASTYETLNLSGTGIKRGGAMIFSASTNNNFGVMTVTANTMVKNFGSGIVTFGGTITAANNINFWIGGTGPTTIAGQFGATATSATITKADAGTLRINTVSITTGLVRINGGTLQYGVADALGTPAVTIAGGTWDLNGYSEGGTTLISTVTLIDGSIVNTGGAATITSSATYTVENGTISAVLAGAAIAMAKNTGGTVTLSAANTFAGTTTINAGTLAWGIDNALSSGALTVTGGIADIGTRTDTVGTVTLTSGAITSSTGILTGTSYAVANGTISAILAGAVNLTKTSVGLVTLSGVNTYTGVTTISAGTLSVSTIGNGGAGGSNLGNATNSAGNIVFNSATGTLQYTGSTASTDRAYTTTNAITTNFDITNPSTVLTWSGAGTATTALINKIGQGTLKFSSAQGHTGLTTVLAGTLQYGIDNMLSTGTVTVNNGVLDINNFSDSVGVITLINGASIIDSGGTTAVLTSTGTGAFQSGTVSARLGGSTASAISKTTSGRVILSGDNSFTSTAIALSAGYLNLRHNNALGASGTTLLTTITSGAVFEFENNITLPSTKTITANGGGVNNVGALRNISGSNTIGANITLGSTNTRINSDDGTLTIPTVSGNTYNVLFGGAGNTTVTGAISTTSGNLTKDGAGVLTLSGVNTYTGSTTITLGTIVANSTSSIGDGSVTNTLIFNGGTLQASGDITSPSNRAVTLSSGGGTINTNGNSVSIAGTVGSSGGLTKSGAGTLTITGVTTIGGNLTISAGTFVAPTSLTLNGDFINNGTYTHNNGTLTLVPSGGVSNILGSSNTTFYNFTNETANSTVNFKAGNTYTFANLLTFTGTELNPIIVKSDTNSVQWLMALSGTSAVTYVRVKDSGCSEGNLIPESNTIYDDGNNGNCWIRFITRGGGGGVESGATPSGQEGNGQSGFIQLTNAGSRYWFSVASSSDGTKLIAAVNGGYIYTSSDSGVNWTERTNAGFRDWYGVASSSDGTKLVAVVYGGYIYTSTDSGANWTERTGAGSNDWYGVASSSDGTKLAVSVGTGGYIYTSSDSGANWVERTSAGQRNWSYITSSADGVNLAAVDLGSGSGGYIYTSSDSGANWVERTGAGNKVWYSIASSSDGVKLVVVPEDGYIYTSINSGANWTERTSAGSRAWKGITSSSDGIKLTASSNGYIYTSVDSGANWTERTSAGSRFWRHVATSSNGNNTLLAVGDGYLYLLNDVVVGGGSGSENGGSGGSQGGGGSGGGDDLE